MQFYINDFMQKKKIYIIVFCLFVLFRKYYYWLNFGNVCSTFYFGTVPNPKPNLTSSYSILLSASLCKSTVNCVYCKIKCNHKPLTFHPPKRLNSTGLAKNMI